MQLQMCRMVFRGKAGALLPDMLDVKEEMTAMKRP